MDFSTNNGTEGFVIDSEGNVVPLTLRFGRLDSDLRASKEARKTKKMIVWSMIMDFITYSRSPYSRRMQKMEAYKALV